MDRVIVTIGLCVKNAEKTLKRTLESIVSQNFPEKNIEIIFVDGNSRDKTLEIINNFIRCSKIKASVFSDGGRGLGTARQKVLDHAKGTYILWIDGDVILADDFLKRQLIFMRFMRKRSPIGLVRGKGEYIETGRLISDVQNLLFTALDIVYFGATISITNMLKQVGGFDKRIVGAAEDVDILTRLNLSGWQLAINKKAKFSHISRHTLKDIFREYSWYGYGDHFLYHKYEGLIKIPYRLFPIYFGWGVKVSRKAYKEYCLRKAFLIPFLCFFISVCWFLGFLRGHIHGYGHAIKKPEIRKEALIVARRLSRLTKDMKSAQVLTMKDDLN
ncbi:MAG: glycosyltransferase [Candidatus Bathyarchaeia archaeon]